jgi:hypothetical protein
MRPEERMRSCHACGTEFQGAEKVLRTEECAGCGRDLRCCRNCRHFQPGAHNQCLEVVAEWVADKERANFCDYFSFADSSPSAGKPKSAEEEAREKWRSLFKS